MDDKTNKNLQEAGLKATLPRIKILEIMQRTAGTEDHYTAEDIYKELVMNSYDIGLATVYRVLTQFENAGMVVKHKFEEARVNLLSSNQSGKGVKGNQQGHFPRVEEGQSALDGDGSF